MQVHVAVSLHMYGDINPTGNGGILAIYLTRSTGRLINNKAYQVQGIILTWNAPSPPPPTAKVTS